MGPSRRPAKETVMARKPASAGHPRAVPAVPDPQHRWDRPIQAPGHMQVDFEERVDFRRLHDYRLGRVRRALAGSGLGALLVFDQHNIRYLSGTVIGEWARDKLIRYSLLTGPGEPWVWDFGSAARHHRLYAPWLLPDHCLAGMVGMRGAVPPTAGLFEQAAREIEAINAISGERCSPHPHIFTDRMLRPGDQAFFDIIQSFVGYRTCYYRTFSVGRATAAQQSAYKRAREWMDSAIELIKPGVGTDRITKSFPKAQEIGFESEMAAFGLNFCHGLGLGLHERPIISRLNSLDDPMELEAGMVFAVETYCPASDGVSAARIEEEVIVTPKGAQIITLFPADELPIANRY